MYLHASGATLSVSPSVVTYYLADQSITVLPIFVALGLVELVLGVLGVVFGMVAFAWASCVLPFFTSACAHLGRKTLSIYVLHLPVLAVFNWLLEGTMPPSLITLIYPFFALPAVIFICLILRRILVLVRANWLFSVPWASHPAPTEAHFERFI